MASGGVKKLAYLVGIEEYGLLNPARYARNDAEKLGEALRNSCAFNDVIDAGERAYKKIIIDRLNGCRAILGPSDTFLFYFAGHGLVHGEKSYLLGYGASGDAATAKEDSVDLECAIGGAIAAGAGQTILMFDCCREDPLPGRGHGDNLMTQTMLENTRAAYARGLFPVQGRNQPEIAVLFACSPGQRAWADLLKKHGVFSSAVLDGLSQPATTYNGRFTMEDLHKFVAWRLEKWTEKHPGKAMKPHLITHGSIRIISHNGTRAGQGTDGKDRRTGYPFQFFTGKRVQTIPEWLEWLLLHPKNTSDEVRAPGLEEWLKQHVSGQAAGFWAKALHAQQNGVWLALFDLAFDLGNSAVHLLAPLQKRMEEVRKLLHPSESIADYFSDLARLQEAEEIDRYNPKIEQLRSALEQRIKEVGSGRKRQMALKEARHLFHEKQWTGVVRLLRAIAKAGRIHPNEAVGFDGCNGPPEPVEIGGVEYLRVPAGMITMMTGRIASLSSFLISKRPVRVRDYTAVMGTPGRWPSTNLHWEFQDRSIVQVSWIEASRYCTQRGGHLPSEAQWEYFRRFATEHAVWLPLAEWCRDAYCDTPALDPAIDPCVNCSSTGAEGYHIIRKLDHPRYGRKAEEKADDLSFRIVRETPPVSS